MQKTWSPPVVLRIGTALVDAHAQAGHVNRAVHLADTLYHNLRSSRSVLAPEVLDLVDQLAAILLRAKRPVEVVTMFEDLLREIDDIGAHMRMADETRNGGLGNGHKNGDMNGLKKAIRMEVRHDPSTVRNAASRALNGIRRVVRSTGGWSSLGARGDGSKRATYEMYSRLKRFGDIDVPAIDAWDTAKVTDSYQSSSNGSFEWSIVSKKEVSESTEKRDFVMLTRERWGLWEDGLAA